MKKVTNKDLNYWVSDELAPLIIALWEHDYPAHYISENESNGEITFDLELDQAVEIIKKISPTLDGPVTLVRRKDKGTELTFKFYDIKNILPLFPKKKIFTEKELANYKKCVHTEHCCIRDGCKYGDKDCPVWLGYKPQSMPCESCYWDHEHNDGPEPEIPTVTLEELEKRRAEDSNPWDDD